MANDNIEKTAVWADIKTVMDKADLFKPANMRLMIHTVNHDIIPYKLVTFFESEEFDTQVGATSFITFMVPTGEYTAKIYPERSNLEVSIKILPYGKVSSENKPYVVKYRALFPKGKNPVPTGASTGQFKTTDQNMAGFLEVTLELVDKGVEAMTLKTTGGIYNNLSQEDLLRSIIAGESQSVQIDGAPAIQSVDIYKTTNQDKNAQIVVPDSSPVINIPTILQEKVGGLYSTGLGNFIRMYRTKRTFFVYPLYDYDRYDKVSDKGIIYLLPQDRFNGIDRTYMLDGKILKILCANNMSMVDDGDVASMNEGTGFRMTDARAIMKKPVLVSETGEVKAARAQLNHEVAIGSRTDGYMKAVRKVDASANPYKEYSRLCSAASKTISLQWDNSDTSLLYPGMPFKVVFLQDGKRKEMNCILHKALSATKVAGQVSHSDTYVTATTMVLAAAKFTEAPLDQGTGDAGRF